MQSGHSIMNGVRVAGQGLERSKHDAETVIEDLKTKMATFMADSEKVRSGG